MDNVGLIASFESQREIYESFAQTVSNLVTRLLGADGVIMHSVSHRCKTLNSFKLKIEKKNSYDVLSQVTDLAGIRLITHYEDDVDKVAKIIESEFLIDADNSIDKRKALDPDRFGYLSLHYVVSLRSERTELKEYRSFAGLKAEIQVRSILQHTWAEIEHDTGYKSNIEVPKHIRRRFSRLAGLLELADQEFIGIRSALEDYSVAVATRIVEAPSERSEELEVLIDKVSLQKFLELDPLVDELDQKICEILNAKLGVELNHIPLDVSRLQVVGVDSLSKLKAALKDNYQLIIERAKFVANSHALREQSTSDPVRVRFAICILYLLQILAAKNGDLDSTLKNLGRMGFKMESDLALSLKGIIDAHS